MRRAVIWLLLGPLVLLACAPASGDPVAGRELYLQENLGARRAPGCITCHSLEPGEEKLGPSHAQVGSQAEQRVKGDDYEGQARDAAAYLRESILQPNAHVIDGYEAGIMYQQYDEVLTEDQVDDLVAFLLSLR